MERQLLLNVSLMAGSAVPSLSSMSFFPPAFFFNIFPFHSVHDLLWKQMVERSLGRNKLQGRCLWISELREREKKCQGGTYITGGVEGGKERGWMAGCSHDTQHLLPWYFWVLSLRCITKQKLCFPPKHRQLFYLAVWYNTMSFHSYWFWQRVKWGRTFVF